MDISSNIHLSIITCHPMMARGQGKIGDKRHGELFKWKECGRANWRERRACGMVICLVLLASGASRDEGVDKGG